MRLDMKLKAAGLEKEDAEKVERRTRFALGRFGHCIQRAEVVLRDIHGPQGGPDKHCRVRVLMSGLAAVVVEVTDIEPVMAVNRALERAARQVRDALNRACDAGHWRGGGRHRIV